MRAAHKAFRFLFKALEWFAMICMVILTVIVFIDVILRYIFKQGFAWTQEVATLMLVWFSLIGMAIGVLESIDHVLMAIFGGLMVYYGIVIMNMTKLSTMPATKMPSAVLYIILPLSGILVFLNALLVAAKRDSHILQDAPASGKEDSRA